MTTSSSAQDIARFSDSSGACPRDAAVDTDLACLWVDLLAGAVVIVDQVFDETECGLVFRTLAERAPVMERRRIEIVEAVLTGTSQNFIAIDKCLAPSTVAVCAKQALERFGVSARPSRVHPLLMLMATASATGTPVLGKRWQVSARDEFEVSIRRPGFRFERQLPEAERRVTQRLVDGWCYARIAQERGTAQRTVANQISAVFRRFQVSGRNELVCRLFELDGLVPDTRATEAPATPRAEQGMALAKSRESGVRTLSSLCPALQALAGVARG